MNLHVKVEGQGDPLVMLHGWGMHGDMWGSAAESLAQHFRLLLVDLPGHGASPPPAEFTLDSVVERLVAQFDEPVSVCGWSLGGQIAMHWAVQMPEQIKSLVLVSSTPCFAERDDWKFAMPLGTLNQFSADLENDHAATLRRFLSLQVRGSVGERELLATLRASLSSQAAPDPVALRGGLQILRDADLRAVLPEIKQPALIIAGERDKLTPPQASYLMAEALPDARVVEIKGAAHAPFLSHDKEFVRHVLDFMDDGQS